MSNKEDFNQMSEGIDKARDLINQKSFDEYRGDEITGISEGIDKSNKDEVIRGLTETDYHPCGTCRMGVLYTTNTTRRPRITSRLYD